MINKVSIITVSYNSAETIKDTIQSVVDQDYDNIEYLIVDGKSSDNTLEIVESFGDQISKVVSEKDNGIYDALNKGINMATGDLVAILNSDDVYASNQVISSIVSLMNAEGTDTAYADLVYVDRFDLNKVIRYWKSGAYKQGIFLKGWMPPHPTFFVKKEVYNKLGVFNLSLRTAADYEIMLRILHKHQTSVSYLPETIVRMRVGGVSNMSLKNRIKANREDKKAWELNGLKPGPMTLLFKPLSKIFQYIKKEK